MADVPVPVTVPVTVPPQEITHKFKIGFRIFIVLILVAGIAVGIYYGIKHKTPPNSSQKPQYCFLETDNTCTLVNGTCPVGTVGYDTSSGCNASLQYAITFPAVGTYECTQTSLGDGATYYKTQVACTSEGNTIVTSPYYFVSQQYACIPNSVLLTNDGSSFPGMSLTLYSNASACIEEQCNDNASLLDNGIYMCNSMCTANTLTQCLEDPFNVTDASVCVETDGKWGCVCRYPITTTLSMFDNDGNWVSTSESENNCIGYTVVNTGEVGMINQDECTFDDKNAQMSTGNCTNQSFRSISSIIMICPDNTPCTIGGPLLGANGYIPDMMYVCASDVLNFPKDQTKWRQCEKSVIDQANLGTVIYNDVQPVSELGYPPVYRGLNPVTSLFGPLSSN